MKKSKLLLVVIFCLCLVGCSKEDKVVGGFGTGETDVSESITESSVSSVDFGAVEESSSLVESSEEKK